MALPRWGASLRGGLGNIERLQLVVEENALAPLLKLKYNNAIADAIVDLGEPAQIKDVFVGFQRYLYQRSEAVIDPAR